MELKQPFKEKWLAALRSGTYQQTKGTLKNKEGYCCLGVAVCVLVEEIPELIPSYTTIDTKDDEIVVRESGDIPRNKSLTYLLRASMGLSSVDMRELMRLNDLGASFEEIASIIEGGFITSTQ